MAEAVDVAVVVVPFNNVATTVVRVVRAVLVLVTQPAHGVRTVT